jgi:D-sedoheptulose 7-phosphate isomerase
MKSEIAELAIRSHIEISNQILRTITKDIMNVGLVLTNALKDGKKVVLFGNGGSAADAQHIAAELSGRFLKERKGLAGLALTTDTSVITAIGNDYGYDVIFERQVEALCSKGDVLIGISTSGNSKNVVKGLLKGKELHCVLVSLTGNEGGQLRGISDFNLNVNSSITARVQEMHILFGHILCEYVDEYLSGQ